MNDPPLPATVGPLIQRVHRSVPQMVIGFGIIAFLAGSVAVCAAIFYATGMSGKLKDAKVAQGRVIRMAAGHSPAGSPAGSGTAPIVEIEVNGQKHEVRGKVFSHPPSFKVGQTVRVYYPPDNPAEGIIDSFAERWFMPLAFGAAGTVFLIVGLVIILKFIWRRTTSTTVSIPDSTT